MRRLHSHLTVTPPPSHLCTLYLEQAIAPLLLLHLQAACPDEVPTDAADDDSELSRKKNPLFLNQSTWEGNRLKIACNVLRICEFGQNSVFLTLEQFFKELSQNIIAKIDSAEDLMLNFWGEDSHFTRFNQSKVRQNGFVSDATLSITLISKQRT